MTPHNPTPDVDCRYGGAYWGLGAPLYWWSVTIVEGDSTDECDGFLRARSRDDAKRQVRELHPGARFYR